MTAAVPRRLQTLIDAALDRWQRDEQPHAGRSARRLAAALAEGRVQVAYQPIVALHDRRLVAVEALLRLHDGEDAGLGTAAAVVAVAEDDGLIDALGTYVLIHACSQLTAWRSRPELAELQLHVNISPWQLRDERFVATLQQTLEHTRLDHDDVILEVTETAAFGPDGVAEATLSTLDALDIEVAIDDFGTGFASLDLLAATPARSIKLDRSFVASVGAITEPPRGRALVVQAAIGLGRALGLRVVAEGIETPEQAHTLQAWGCVYGQGFLFAKPAFADELDLSPPPAQRPAVAATGTERRLSNEAIDLALALALALVTAAARPQSVRADAQQLALLLGETLGIDRRQADIAAVLATIHDAPQRFAEVVTPKSGSAAAVDLARELGAGPGLLPDAGPGQLAAAAWLLSIARHERAELTTTLTRLGTPLSASTRERIEAWWHGTDPEPAPITQLRTLEARLRHRDEASRRLRSMSALTRAVSGAGTLLDVLEVTAEEARVALGAASLSITRLERDRGVQHTLVNVGELAGWEQRRPTDEAYPFSAFPRATERLLNQAIHVAVAGAGQDPPEEQMLDLLDKGSSAAVPIVIDGTTWGEVYATTNRDTPAFTASDAPFLRAVANVVALAIRRTEHVGELARLADEDPLTRLGNRRALERHLGAACAGDTEMGLLLLDVDGLSAINDVHGSPAGDAVLVEVGDALTRVAATTPNVFAARLGGDEFCLAMTGGSSDIESILDRIRRRLAGGNGPRPSLSAGYAQVRCCDDDAIATLLRRADAAQFLASRTGAPLVAVGPDSDLPAGLDVEAPTPGVPGGDATGTGTARAVIDRGVGSDAALWRWADQIDGPARNRLEGLGELAVSLLDLNRYALSEQPTGRATVHIQSLHVRRRRPNFAPFVSMDDEVYEVADFPVTERAIATGCGFVVDVDDPRADAAERALLTEFGHRYLIAIGEAHPDGGGLLLELYGDEQSRPLAVALPLLEALAARTLGRDVDLR